MKNQSISHVLSRHLHAHFSAADPARVQNASLFDHRSAA
jgi:hypothetical protein